MMLCIVYLGRSIMLITLRPIRFGENQGTTHFEQLELQNKAFIQADAPRTL